MKINIFDPDEFEPRSTCHVAAAVIGGVTSIGGSLISAGASKSAADAQVQAANNATAAQRAMFEEGKGEVQPFVDFGKNLMPSLQGWIDPNSNTSPLATLMKLTSPGADLNSMLSQLPGLNFQQTYGQQAVNNALAARGLAGPGGALARGSANYAEGLAQSNYNNYITSLLNTFQAGAGAMQNGVNTGASAASSLLGGATQVGGQIGSNMIGAGNAQAAGILGQGNALSGLTNNLGSYALMARLGGGSGGLFSSSPSFASGATSVGGLTGDAPWAPSNAWYNN